MIQRWDCCEPRRLAAVRIAGVLNGIEYVEVSDSQAPSQVLRQRTLFVRLLAPDPTLTGDNLTITGGDRIPVVDVEWVAPATALPAGEDPDLVADLRDPATVLLVRTAQRGDFSRYTLSLVAGVGVDVPPAGWDPMLTTVDFSFKVECTADADCAIHEVCPPEMGPAPQVDYLAKDWESFRRVMLDRLSLVAPQWTERHPADLGVTLVELLAWLGDELSYRQDAVATEAWLRTARRRTSLRRHARLVDYRIGEGSNARTWVHFTVEGDGVVIPASAAVLTGVPRLPVTFEAGSPDHRTARTAGAETFETMGDLVAYGPPHDVFDLWTWGDTGCCLAKGATRATLVGHHPQLKAGDVLVLVEVVGPRTGNQDDADPAQRWPVRLTHVVSSTDPSGGLFATPSTNDPLEVTEIEWDEADALPFPLCVSVQEFPGMVMSRALGNIALADHGRTVTAEDLGDVGSPVLEVVGGGGACLSPTPQPIPLRHRPTLAETPLTHARGPTTGRLAESPLPAGVATELATLTFGPDLQAWLQARGVTFDAGPAVVRGGDSAWSVSDGETVAPVTEVAGTLTLWDRPESATASRALSPAELGPAITLEATTPAGSSPWRPRPDLLASAGDAREFVVELEHDRTATLRFGDGIHGRRPDPGTHFTATYRVGNGPAGNIGADALSHVITTNPAIIGVANPMPAMGGRPPEQPDAIRRDAPEAFLVQQRAVTVDDWIDKASDHPQVQRAAATFRWTGSWHTVFVTTDRTGGEVVDVPFETDVRTHLEPFRIAGYDLEVDGPVFVALDVALHVCVEPDHFRAHVLAAVLDVLASGIRRDGTFGLFHPDRFTFAQPVHLSAIVAATQAVAGVQSVAATRFGRLREPGTNLVDQGVIKFGRLEIARLDADPNFPERGRLVVTTGGGK